MLFILIPIVIILMIITIRIKIKFENFEFFSQDKQHLRDDYKIKIVIYTFNYIPTFKISITNKKIKKALDNEKIQKTIKEQKIKIIENRKDIDLNVIKEVANIKIEIKEIDLKIRLGTRNATTTAFLIPIISTVIATVLSKKVEAYNEKQKFSIQPVYADKNLLNIEFSGIFQIKMIHIIDIVCKIKKKGDKNERTSYRRSYDYGYE